MKLIWVAVGIALVSGENAWAQVPLYKDLGDHHFRITTSSKVAQQYFDQGLKLVYGFNHAEAVRSFRAAQEADPKCAMCFWGEARAFGPNLNGAMDSASGIVAYAAVQKAKQLAPRTSAKEQAFVNALSRRFAASPMSGQSVRDTSYAKAMQKLAAAYPRDDDAHTLHADAQMNLSPWDYYREGVAKPNAAAALKALELVTKRSPKHAGACHFYIHAVEAANPELALPCAERLPSLMPGAGHIVHMPAHIYIRVGRYNDAIDRNVHALHADEQHIADLAPDGAYRLAYYPHNAHFLWFVATMAGREDIAIEAAKKTAELTNTEMMRAPGLGALQHYLVTPLFAAVRFERWNDVLNATSPEGDLAYPTGVYHYARAMAYSARGDFAKAKSELTSLDEKRSSQALDGVTIWGFNSAKAVLDIAYEAAAGDIALREGNVQQAIERFRKGIVLEDKMGYDEPPTWHLPVRHQLGHALLVAGDKKAAERAFQEDLKRHPKNKWSLDGLAKAQK